MHGQKRVYYEWSLDTYEGEDIIDLDHFDRLVDIPEPAANQGITLHRIVGDEVHGLVEREYASVEHGELPDFFSGGSQVPERFKRLVLKRR